MLNQPNLVYESTEQIIDYWLEQLREQLAELGITDEFRFDYSFFDRCEWLGVKSADILPDYELPGDFGVYRDYAGGGIHTGLKRTQTDRLKPKQRDKAERLLDIFEQTFWDILKDVERASCEADSEREDWDSVEL